MTHFDSTSEWIETNGLGGFAMGTVRGERTRRYHGLLMTDRQQQRRVLVHGLEVWAQTPNGTYPISTQVYANGTTFPHGFEHLRKFANQPWPKWHFVLPDGTQISQEVIMVQEHEATLIRWSLVDSSLVRLHVRPLISGRDYHSLQQTDSNFDFSFQQLEASDSNHFAVAWRPHEDLPSITVTYQGNYEHHPNWFRDFHYQVEYDRGLDCVEDLASPGEFHLELNESPQILAFSADEPISDVQKLLTDETARRSNLTPLKLAASQFIVRRDQRDTIIAGYPWFTDWGRDTFISLRGLCLASGELAIAKRILLAWSDTVSEGMLPNRFSDGDHPPEYNSVDASLWYVIATHEFLSLSSRQVGLVNAVEEARLIDATTAIIEGYHRGTRHQIQMDDDGLIAAGEPGVQLTWMDAKVDDWVVTPRIGKPVEIQALWLNSLWLAGRRDKKWATIFDDALPTFRKKFWNESAGALFDIVDVDHAVGTVDASFRPNQIFAVGGLPYVLIEGKRAKSIVEGVERRLWTPLGLRTLAPEDPRYRGRYEGGRWERDGAYHQGTAWAWLLGPFVDAWLRVRGYSTEAKQDAKQRFWEPIERHMTEHGLGHITEVADGNAHNGPADVRSKLGR